MRCTARSAVRQVCRARQRSEETAGDRWRSEPFEVPSRSPANEREECSTGRRNWCRRCCGTTTIDPEDLISILFTATPDLTADFPAYAARQLGLTDVPLMCASRSRCPGRCRGCCGCWPTSRPSCPAPRSGTSTCAARPSCGPTWPASSRAGRQRILCRRAQPRPFTGWSRSTGRPAPASRPWPGGWPARLGAQYLDTGAMYRAATVAVLRAGVDPSDPAAIARGGDRQPDRGQRGSGAPAHPAGRRRTSRPRSATPQTTAAVSAVSAVPARSGPGWWTSSAR